MTIDSKVIEAIYAAVENRNQPDKLAKRLAKLITDLSNSNASLDSKDDIQPSLETILDAIELSDENEDGLLL